MTGRVPRPAGDFECLTLSAQENRGSIKFAVRAVQRADSSNGEGFLYEYPWTIASSAISALVGSLLLLGQFPVQGLALLASLGCVWLLLLLGRSANPVHDDGVFASEVCEGPQSACLTPHAEVSGQKVAPTGNAAISNQGGCKR